MKAKVKNCSVCEKQGIEKNEVGICQKLLGRKIEKFFCMVCLADYLDTTVEALLEKIEFFKADGCALFS
jgi:hypothetical protein